jgi:hypothetical protein
MGRGPLFFVNSINLYNFLFAPNQYECMMGTDRIWWYDSEKYENILLE